MQFTDKKDSRRGSFALLCTKETSEQDRVAWGGITVGNYGEKLDYMVDVKSGTIYVGYREEIIPHTEGVERRTYHLQRYVYLHSDRDPTTISGKVNPDAPLMSVAHQLGAREIHTQIIENREFTDQLIAAGIKIVDLSIPAVSVDPVVVATVDSEQPVKRKSGRPKGASNKPKPVEPKIVDKFKRMIKRDR